ncbi:type II TA system antitoxin MqsA family protein [Secundilactobacillus yichangensis]|uniref:type II TA system antitoxin MqsA family protein n=1 Tax=Secundilactobacillus yichangensis TaxID=2799580 RepID=UPI0019421E0E|nr:type II TA system antitoxin MqsA family protein [Secundilactobacillus yichangensis]
MKTEVRSIDEVYTIRGQQIDVVTNARFNVDDGEQVFDEKLDNNAILIALDQYRKFNGIITPIRIKNIRHSFGLDQRDFATLLGWSVTTVASYETGSLPTDTDNKMLLALESDPDMAQHLYESSNESMNERGKAALEKNTGIRKR